jgi:predicted DNA-binding transcriptional regulator YafY
VSQPSYPTTRLLTMLELLQTYKRMSGPELAQRLEVGERTVRRYVTLLHDLGIPVEAERGRYGGYRLRPGYKLPPLMFTEDEALALVLGLLVVRQSGLAGTAADVEGALGKIERVMPDRLRARVRAVQQAVVLTGAARETRPAWAIIGALSEAAHRRQRVRLQYRSAPGDDTERLVDIYGVVSLEGVWYAVGFDHLRSDMRTFRVDRVVDAQVREETFTPPSDFNPLAHLEHALATRPGALPVEVLLETTLEEARRMIPATAATLEETPSGVLVRGQAEDAQDVATLAHILAGLGCSLVVRHPADLRDALRTLARHAAWLAERTLTQAPRHAGSDAPRSTRQQGPR